MELALAGHQRFLAVLALGDVEGQAPNMGRDSALVDHSRSTFEPDSSPIFGNDLELDNHHRVTSKHPAHRLPDPLEIGWNDDTFPRGSSNPRGCPRRPRRRYLPDARKPAWRAR